MMEVIPRIMEIMRTSHNVDVVRDTTSRTIRIVYLLYDGDFDGDYFAMMEMLQIWRR